MILNLLKKKKKLLPKYRIKNEDLSEMLISFRKSQSQALNLLKKSTIR